MFHPHEVGRRTLPKRIPFGYDHANPSASVPREVGRPTVPDRVVAINRAGYGYLLDQEPREAGVFEVANALDYLRSDARDAWTSCPE